MLDRLQAVENRYEKLNELLSDPEVISDTNKLREYSKEQSDIQETVEVYREYKDVREQLKDAKAMLEDKLDAEMREMVKEEVSELGSFGTSKIFRRSDNVFSCDSNS
ncbi:PCRF domain-containing protein, partial [Bacillus sp. D-CC]